MKLGMENVHLGPIWTFSVQGVLTFVASSLDTEGSVLSYFEGTGNLVIQALHCIKVSFFQCCSMKRYNYIFAEM